MSTPSNKQNDQNKNSTNLELGGMINSTQIRAAGAQTWVVWAHINTLKQTK
jgi:hypothetical protein